MQSIQEDMVELRRQLKIGTIQKAYRALLSYMMALQARFKSRYPSYSITGLYHGYLDISYFAVIPPSFKHRGLKIAIVFNYEAFRFEAWLAGTNRQIQRKYWQVVRNGQWPEYRIMTPGKGVDSIIECNLAESPDFGDLDNLTARIEKNIIEFIDTVERFLSDQETL
ncbi:MAG: hypothetical protein HY774_21955 [Acidobacteria bacterium]|nr:hypothetical protein [Acidobacteriota bacterium]